MQKQTKHAQTRTFSVISVLLYHFWMMIVIKGRLAQGVKGDTLAAGLQHKVKGCNRQHTAPKMTRHNFG